MQERYLGDVHDFLKYAFLRHLSRTTGFKLGLNWYLTDPKHVGDRAKKDGEKRYHLSSPNWKGWDDHLLEQLRPFKQRRRRSLSRFYSSVDMPLGTVFHDQEVEAGEGCRRQWHQHALQTFVICDHVFLDPDNGFLVESATPRKHPKYSYYQEIADYLKMGAAVTCIQFADRQCSSIQRALEVRSRCIKLSGASCKLPVLLGRVAPNILFVSLAPKDKTDELCEAIHSFAGNSPPMDRSGLRVMVID